MMADIFPTSIYSLFLHIQCEENGLEITYDQCLFITIPSFKTSAGSIILPTSTSTNLSVHLNAHREISNQGKLLPELRHYYNEIKTKHQLKLDVPAGFCHLTSTQQHFTTKNPPRKSSTDQDSTPSSMSHPLNLCSSLSSDDTTIVTSNLTSTDSAPIPSSIPTFTPILRSVDKPSSSLPEKNSMSEDFIKACVGYRPIETLKKHFSSLYQPTVTLDHTPADAIIDAGHVATIRKKPRNTTPVVRPSSYYLWPRNFHWQYPLWFIVHESTSLNNYRHSLLTLAFFQSI